MKRTLPLFAMLCASAAALADGRVEGRVGRADSAALLEGAVVQIPSLGLRTTTGSDGRFLFSQVPSGEHTLTVSYLGFAPYTTTVSVAEGRLTTRNVDFGSAVEEIVVYGRQTASAPLRSTCCPRSCSPPWR